MSFASSPGSFPGSRRASVTVYLVLCLLVALWVTSTGTALTASTLGHSDEGFGFDTFYVSKIRFRGNTVFPAAELEAHLAAKVGGAMNLAELEEAAREVTHLYRERGYPLATAYVPPQEVVDGVVEIAIVEGRWGRIILENRSGLEDATLTAMLGQVQSGSVIHTDSLDQAVRLLNETPGVTVHATMRRGTQPETADLIVHVEASSSFEGHISVDNGGAPTTGRWRGSTTLQWSNPTKRGDRATLMWSLGTGTGAGAYLTNGVVSYETFLGTGPTRFDISFGDTRYALGPPFSAVDAQGEGQVLQMTFRYPWERSACTHSDVSMTVSRRMESLPRELQLRLPDLVTMTRIRVDKRGGELWNGVRSDHGKRTSPHRSVAPG